MKKRLSSLLLVLCMVLSIIPVHAVAQGTSIDEFKIGMSDSCQVKGNSDGYAILKFTAPADGLYMIGNNPEMGGVLYEKTEPVISRKYDHDIMVDVTPFCGPVYELQKGVTYRFTVKMESPEQEFYVYNNVEATDISCSVQELTGYVGSYVELYYEVDPVDAFSGVNTSYSSDPTVAEDWGGANWDCRRVIKLLKAGTADITVTLANGQSITVKVTAVEPPALTLGTSATGTLDATDFDVWKFTASKDGIYYVTVDSTSGSCMAMPSDDSKYVSSFNHGTANGMWLNLQKGEVASVLVYNWTDGTDSYTVKADVAGAPTSISLPAWEGYPTQNAQQIRPILLPLGAYAEITGWTVSDPSVLQLEWFYENEAEFSAWKPGTVDVTVTTADGLSATGKFTVKEPMKLDAPETVTLEPGEWKELIFQAPKDGLYFTSMPFHESVQLGISANDNSIFTDESIAVVTGMDGYYLYIDCLKPGTTTLKMTCGGKTYTSTVTVTEPIVVPVDTSTPTTITQEAVDSALESAISGAKPNETVEVVIDADAAAKVAGTTVNTVELSVTSLQKFADANAVLTVKLSGATVTLNAKALETIAKKADGATVTLSVELVDTNSLTKAQQKALSNKKVGAVLTAQILSDGKYIGDFEGGIVTVTVPFTPPAGKNGNSFAVWYVSEEGDMDKMKTGYKDGNLIFETKHFSDYVVLEEEAAPPASNPPTGDRFMLIPVMLLFAVSAMAIVVIGKKRSV